MGLLKTWFSLRAENKRLRAERIALQNDSRAVTCVFCGHVYPPGTPPSNHEALITHIEECPDHPMRKYKLRAEAAEKYLSVFRSSFAFPKDPTNYLHKARKYLAGGGCENLALVRFIAAELEYRRSKKDN